MYFVTALIIKATKDKGFMGKAAFNVEDLEKTFKMREVDWEKMVENIKELGHHAELAGKPNQNQTICVELTDFGQKH